MTVNNFSIKLAELLRRFAAQSIIAQAGGVNSIAYQNLISALNSSAAFLSFISDAVNSGQITDIKAENLFGKGGYFEERPKKDADGKYVLDEKGDYVYEYNIVLNARDVAGGLLNTASNFSLVSILAHEAGHAYFRTLQNEQTIYKDTWSAIDQKAKLIGSQDYTSEFAQLSARGARNEAVANIIAWNALVATFGANLSNGGATSAQLEVLFKRTGYAELFIDYDSVTKIYSLKNGLIFGNDLLVDYQDPINVEKAAKIYYLSSKLGIDSAKYSYFDSDIAYQLNRVAKENKNDSIVIDLELLNGDSSGISVALLGYGVRNGPINFVDSHTGSRFQIETQFIPTIVDGKPVTIPKRAQSIETLVTGEVFTFTKEYQLNGKIAADTTHVLQADGRIDVIVKNFNTDGKLASKEVSNEIDGEKQIEKRYFNERGVATKIVKTEDSASFGLITNTKVFDATGEKTISEVIVSVKNGETRTTIVEKADINGVAYEISIIDEGDHRIITAISVDGMPVDDLLTVSNAIVAAGYDPNNKKNIGEVTAILASSSTNPLTWLKKIRADNSTGNWWNEPGVQKLGNSLSSIQGLIAALKSGNSLGVASASANLATIWSDGATSGVSDALNAWGDVVSLKAALKRGDHTSVLKSGLSLSNSVLKVYRALLEDEVKQIAFAKGLAAAKASQASADLANVTTAMDNINVIISVINIISDLKEENYLEVIASIAALMGYPVIGWILTAGKILAMLVEPDKIYYAKLTLDRTSDGTFIYNFNSATDKEAKASTEAMMKGLLAPILEILTHLPDARLIVDRMPILELDRRKSDTWFITYDDAKTGQTMRSYFDSKGRLLSTGPLDKQIQAIDSDDFFKDIGQFFIDATFNAGAIGAAWEVDSIAEKKRVNQQAIVDARDIWIDRLSNGNTYIAPAYTATLNSVGWAKHEGHLTSGTTTGPTQTLRPIVLDLNGDGIKLMSRNDGFGVLFDVDNDGYAEVTDWIDAHDGILVSDYDANGIIDTGTELFNNINIDALRRGLFALKEFDLDRDDRISADEALFSKLRVWRDLDLNGVASPHELKTMSELGITALNMRNGTFVRHGVTHQVGQIALTADSNGVLVDVFDNVLVVTSEDGSVETFAAAVEDQTKLKTPGVYSAKSEDGEMIAGYDRINAVEDLAIIVNAAQLLKNDVIIASDLDHTSLKIIAVGESVNGSVSYEPATGIIIFTPTANFIGDGFFNYTLSDGAGRTVDGRVRVNVVSVNDLPVIENKILTNVIREVTGKVSASDVESGTDLIYAIAHQGLYGSVTIDAVTGAWTYTRNADEMSIFSGFKPDAFAVKVTDRDGGISLLKILPYNVIPQSTTQVKSVSSPTAQEGSALDFNIVLSEVTTEVTEVVLAPEDQSAQFNVDTNAGTVSFDGGITYLPFSGNKIQVPKGILTFTVRYVTIIDAVAESFENLSLHAATRLNLTPLSGIGTIAEKPVVSIQGPTSVAESAGNVEYTVSLVQASSRTSTVRIHSVNYGASNEDYAGLVPQTLTFLPGETSKKIVVGISQDNLIEGPESFGLILSEANGEILIGTPEFQVVIVDDDLPDPNPDPDLNPNNRPNPRLRGRPIMAGQAGLLGAVQPRRDPLALDLDGDGIETNNMGANGEPILFDHDADGIKTGTGWLRSDDAWLALDLNGNGKIDTGRELFGVDTLLKNGSFAQNGFAALADNDANLDGEIDQLDPIFANLKVWRDLNQDGISQANELSSLVQNKIVSISLGFRAEFKNLGNGNVQTAAGSFVREDGTVQAAVELSSTIANLDLLQNTFFSEFTDNLPLDEGIRALPNISGSGKVRNLSEAIALSAQLGLLVYDYSVKTNRADQIAMLDDFVNQWAATSTFKSLQQQAAGLTNSGVSVNYVLPFAVGTPEYINFLKKIQVVEKFMGFTYGTPTGGVRTTALDASSGAITISLAQNQVANILLAYDRLKSYIYESLLLKTLYRDFLSVEVKELSNGTFDLSGIEKYFDASFSSDPNAAVKFVEIVSAWGLKNAMLVGWDAWAYLNKKISIEQSLPALEVETKDWHVKFFGTTDLEFRSTNDKNFVIGNLENNVIQLNGGVGTAFGGDGNDTISGGDGSSKFVGGMGNDLLLSGSGDDTLDGGEGNDTLGSGAGNDLLSGGNGNDALSSDAGDDTLNGGEGNDSFGAGAGNDLLSGGNGDDRLHAGDGDDFVSAGNGNDTVYGADGIDRLFGGEGNDSIDAGKGDDQLYGENGADYLNGFDGNDLLEGGIGDDTLSGGLGADKYLLSRSSDNDVIEDSGDLNGSLENADTLFVVDGVSSADILLARYRDSDDLTLSIRGSSNSVLIKGYFSMDGRSQIEKIQFDDGTLWDLHTIQTKLLQVAIGGGDLFGFDTDDVIIGGDDADRIYADRGNDVLNAGPGYDQLVGGSGNDTLDGGLGNDTLIGGGGSDVYKFNRDFGIDYLDEQGEYSPSASVDVILFDASVSPTEVSIRRDADNSSSSYHDDLVLSINGTNSTLRIQNYFTQGGLSGSGIEKIQFESGTVWNYNDIKTFLGTGTAANDNLTGTNEDDTLNGFSGDDYIVGDRGNDVLDGGAGNDVLRGGDGSDVYLFGKQSGDDQILDYPEMGNSSSDVDVVKLDVGIAPADVLLRRDGVGDDVLLTISGVSNVLRIRNTLAENGQHRDSIEEIQFLDGTVWNVEAIKAKVLTGTNGDDSLVGFRGADVLDGGAGDDYLDGRTGSDIYRFGRNSGNDTIEEASDSNANTDVILLDAGISPADIKLIRETNTQDLLLTIVGSSNQLRIRKYFYDFVGNGRYIEQIQFADGTVWDVNAVKEQLLRGTTGDDSLVGSDDDDVIDGREGNDELIGNEGSDIYKFGKNSGIDRIQEMDSDANDIDTVVFDSSVLPSDVVIKNVNNDLYLTFTGSSASLTIYAFFVTVEGNNGRYYGIEKFQFSDGTSWDRTTIVNQSFMGTSGADIITGDESDNLLNGLSGNDELFGRDGNDTLVGGDGNDSLVGYYGNDVLIGGSGNDTLVGNEGADSFLFGRQSGNDLIADGYGAEAASDSIVLEEGVLPSDVILKRQADDLLLNIVGESNALRVKNYFEETFRGNEFEIGTIKFADGTSWDSTRIKLEAANNINRAPVVASPIIDQNAKQNILFNFTFASTTFVDPNIGDVLSYRAELASGGAMPSWLKLNSATRTFSGTPTTMGTVSVKVFAKDNAGLEVFDTFDIVVGSANQTLNGTSSADNLVGNVGNDTLTGLAGNDALSGGRGNDIYVFNRGDGQDTVDNLDLLTATDTLRFATGVIDTDVLAFKSGNHLAFKLKNSTDQVVIANYYATNTTINGQAADYKIDKVEFSNPVSWNQTMIQTMVDRATNNKAPTLGTAVPNQNSKVDLAYSFTVPVNTIVDADVGDTVTYSLKMQDGSALPTWLSFNATTRVISGTPTLSNLGSLSLTLWGTDNYGTALGQNLSMTVNPANRAPVVAVSVPDQIANQGTVFNYKIPSNSFSDPDIGDVLTYSATLADGTALPSWLTLNATTGAFSGTPISVGTLSIKVTAKDSGNLNASDVFDLTVNVSNLNLTGTTGADTLNGASGNDTISGLAGNDKLTGNAGNDSLDGGAGSDTLIGGLGDDTYLVDATTDVVTENANEGSDTIKSSVTLTLAANVENLTLTGTTAINGTGNALNNVLTGNSAINTLDGGVGADTLAGAAGNDIYTVDNINDVIVENASEGTDQVNSSVSFTLSANVENLTLTGTASINATGNAAANTLTGNAGNNVLDGGAGNDSMVGGAGNDTYVVDSSGDTVTEAASAGTDLVQSSVSFTLGTNLENLTLTGTANINATGNTAANILFGNSGNNVLDGGTGADAMSGGAGNDIYLLDNAGDVITENASEGIDQVKSSLTYTLIANLEALLLTGTTAINGTGNALDNLLTGNSGKNVLNGGAGNDILQGVAGDDTLTDTAGNNIFDGGAGIDVITAGVGNDFIVGGLGNDTITTSTGVDVVAFNRGDGMDTLVASTGKDNTLSLGKGIKYADLLFKKSGNDLILVTGTSEQVTMKDWYTNVNNRSIANLQIVIEGTTDYNAASTNKLNNKKIGQFNFDGLATKFDQARAANPSLTSWALSSSLLEFYLTSSDTAAIGGDLAYQYAKAGNLSAFSMTPAQALLSSAQYGTSAQALQASANLQDASVRLV